MLNDASSSVDQDLRFASKLALWDKYQQLLSTHRAQWEHEHSLSCPAGEGQGEGASAYVPLSQVDLARALNISNASLSRMIRKVAQGGIDALKDHYHKCGRKHRLELTPEEATALKSIYLQTNRKQVNPNDPQGAGSMRTACKLFALLPDTREIIRAAILFQLDKDHVPRFCKKVLRDITSVHFAAHRSPSKLGCDHLAGHRGGYLDDIIHKRRVVESDDATLNFPAWIPCEHGGDPCSDKYGVRFGRWQFLPAIEAGYSRYYLGYSLVARPRGSYTQEDVRQVISLVVNQFGLPDAFRFERGTWESNSVTELLKRLGIDLRTVYQSNHKAAVENGMSSLWTYLSLVPGQVGRFRGEMEKTTKLEQQCRAGLADPRELFPSYKETIAALDGALALRNSDKIKSIYGDWIPEVRHKQLCESRPWPQLNSDLEYLFSPIVRDWTVTKGSVGGKVTLADDLRVPFYFSHDDLWRSNGHIVRVYFDPVGTASLSASGGEGRGEVVATLVATDNHCGYNPGDIICRATLQDGIPSYTRAAFGWSSPTPNLNPNPTRPSNRNALAAIRRETHALAPGGRVNHSLSESRDGQGNLNKIERGQRPSSPINPVNPVNPVSIPTAAPASRINLFPTDTEEEPEHIRPITPIIPIRPISSDSDDTEHIYL